VSVSWKSGEGIVYRLQAHGLDSYGGAGSEPALTALARAVPFAEIKRVVLSTTASPALETIMRYLLCTALVLAACDRPDTARDTRTNTDTIGPAARPEDRAMSAVADRLLGTWSAKGYDAGSNRAQDFTITWTRAPDGSLGGSISFPKGETYDVKVVSTQDSTIVYESEPHRSPTLNAQVVTRTEARIRGDSLTGTYQARAQGGGKVLRGRFTARRGPAAQR
jgi:hypothetical protein